MLIAHIIIALSSIAVSTWAVLFPSNRTIQSGKWLIGGTLASGIALVVSNQQHLLHVCLSGLAYTAAVTLLTFAAARRLAAGKAS